MKNTKAKKAWLRDEVKWAHCQKCGNDTKIFRTREIKCGVCQAKNLLIDITDMEACTLHKSYPPQGRKGEEIKLTKITT